MFYLKTSGDISELNYKVLGVPNKEKWEVVIRSEIRSYKR